MRVQKHSFCNLEPCEPVPADLPSAEMEGELSGQRIASQHATSCCIGSMYSKIPNGTAEQYYLQHA